ncbi:MAG: hypothetical protein F4X02_02100 [Chloroflexi bacterium]|nr:hypothetical protein [Chloroflexota bacterium]
MKKAQRVRALSALLSRLESRDFDRREHALFELAVMLRRANQRAADDDPLSAAELPRELSRIRLTLDEQRIVADRLLQLAVSRRDSRASAVWAMSESAANAGWESILRLLDECGEQLTGEAAFQACRALRLWLASGELSGEMIRRAMALGSLTSLLGIWSQAGDARLKRAAQDVLDSLHSATPLG